MQLIEKDLQLSVPPAAEDALFFDIETTGLSPKNSHIYLLGCVSYSNELWHFKQWLIESPHEERAALVSFNDYITKFNTLVHFNGDRFDIPYVVERCRFLCLPDIISSLSSFDLFRKLRRTKELLHLPGAHQKNFEAFVGNVRYDTYDGGQLINIYHEYQRDSSPEKLAALLLHNEEDVLGMPSLYKLLPYAELFDKDAAHVVSMPEVVGDADADCSYLIFKAAKPFEYDVSARVRFAHIKLCGDQIGITIPIFRGELKYFYPHARDYYYLPDEDMAVHKSVAAYVDAAHKLKATAETCYVKKTAHFLRLPAPICGEVFYKELGSEPYAEMTAALFADVDFWNSYISELFKKPPKQEL